MQIKWEIVAVLVIAIIAVTCWSIYAYKKNKLTILPILKRDGLEPLAVSPAINLKHFLLIRVTFTIYAYIAWIYSNIYDFPKMYSFYTVWNYTILLFYFTSVTIFSMITYCAKNGISDNKYFNYYRVLTWIIFQCECSLSLLVDITVWFILVPSSNHPLVFLQYDSISMHILNVLFLFIDLSINNIPIYFHFGIFAIIPALIYLIFSWLYYDLESKWDYFFMDSTKPINAVWLSIVFMMHLLSWCFVWKIAQWKQNYYGVKNVSINTNNNNLSAKMKESDVSLLGTETSQNP